MGYHLSVGVLHPPTERWGPATLQEFEIGPASTEEEALDVLKNPASRLKTTFPKGCLIIARGPAPAEAAPVASIFEAGVVSARSSRPKPKIITERHVRVDNKTMRPDKLSDKAAKWSRAENWWSHHNPNPDVLVEIACRARIEPLRIIELAIKSLRDTAAEVDMEGEAIVWLRAIAGSGMTAPLPVSWKRDRLEALKVGGETSRQYKDFLPIFGCLEQLELALVSWRKAPVARYWSSVMARAFGYIARARASARTPPEEANDNITLHSPAVGEGGAAVYFIGSSRKERLLQDKVLAQEVRRTIRKAEVLVGLLVDGDRLVLNPS